MMYVWVCWVLAAAVVCSSAQSDMDVHGISVPFQTRVHAGNSSVSYNIKKTIVLYLLRACLGIVLHVLYSLPHHAFSGFFSDF